jgi:hypothetical protein
MVITADKSVEVVPPHLSDEGDGFVPHGVGVPNVRLDDIGKGFLHACRQFLGQKEKRSKAQPDDVSSSGFNSLIIDLHQRDTKFEKC